MGFLITWLSSAVATALAVWIVPGIEVVGGSILGPALCALFLAIVNATIRPLAQLLALPFTILTLGIFYFIVDAAMLELASYLSREVFHAGISIASFGSAFLGAIMISFFSSVIYAVLCTERA